MEKDVLDRLRDAWASPERLPADELLDMLSKAITEIELLRMLVDNRKVAAVEAAISAGA